MTREGKTSAMRFVSRVSSVILPTLLPVVHRIQRLCQPCIKLLPEKRGLITSDLIVEWSCVNACTRCAAGWPRFCLYISPCVSLSCSTGSQADANCSITVPSRCGLICHGVNVPRPAANAHSAKFAPFPLANFFACDTLVCLGAGESSVTAERITLGPSGLSKWAARRGSSQ